MMVVVVGVGGCNHFVFISVESVSAKLPKRLDKQFRNMGFFGKVNESGLNHSCF